MLIALFDGERTNAAGAERGREYRCPRCGRETVLKQGRVVVAHFAHKPPVECDWAKGETLAHLQAKRLVADAFAARGLRAEVEAIVAAGDRRADVMTWSPGGLPIAIELQHVPIGIDEIEARARSYARAGIAQMWIPFLPPSALRQAKRVSHDRWHAERYAARPFERWTHGFNGKTGMWMYDAASRRFWLGRFVGLKLYVAESAWRTEDGSENFGGDFYRWSKRWRQLDLTGPCEVGTLRLAVAKSRERAIGGYRWPAGKIATFVVADR